MLVSSGVSACAINYAGSNVAPRIVEDTAFVWVCGNSFTSGSLVNLSFFLKIYFIPPCLFCSVVLYYYYYYIITIYC